MIPTLAPVSHYILIVEDDRPLREALTEALTLEGYDVVAVENGEVALRHLRVSTRPCVILLDLMMPVMDGWTFRRAMLGDPALADIPVVVMTATAAAQRASTGADDLVLRKPLHMNAVVDVVQVHCPNGAA